ncbi:MAG: MTH1187 family thiamine-binding protein [Proteobacteria bacterium]|nr:MTH1187 family thiamine-binding protein [Pseudomonadota bacterium]MBU1455550.1 MTH1187 family thiamine-binding protein [Pseudomonadota bacterium]
MALLQLTMIPMGEGVSVGEYVVDIQKSLQREGATFRLNDMGTVIEGEVQDLLQLLGKIYETPFHFGAVRVITQIVIDDRRDKEVHIGDKILSVTQKNP